MLGRSIPKSARAKHSPMMANSTRLRASQTALAPKSSTTVSPTRVGKRLQMAGRSMPDNVRIIILDMAISAPVLPAETTPEASPSFTASMAFHILELRPCRSAWLGLASPVMMSGAWRMVTQSESLASAATSGASRASSPNSKNLVFGYRMRANATPFTTISGAWSPPMASIEMICGALTRSPSGTRLTYYAPYCTQLGKRDVAGCICDRT